MKIKFDKERRGFEIKHGNDFLFSFHLMDLKNIWKRKGVNRAFSKVKLVKSDSGCSNVWFSYWTPVWHENRGPYVTMGFMGLRYCRGY